MGELGRAITRESMATENRIDELRNHHLRTVAVRMYCDPLDRTLESAR